MIASKSLKLFINPIPVYSVKDILKIHQFLFEDMYHWAGEFRKVNISKSGNDFLPIQSFDTAIKFVFFDAPKMVRLFFCAIIEINKRRALMIGENIKTLRKTHDLTQPEFAKIIGISRNSLSRYENGTSSVSTELVDRICKKFNVSYIDIVGEEKMLTPVEDYHLTLKIELIKERGANILAQLYRFQDEQVIEFDDSSNPWVLMSDDLSDLINTKIYLVATFEELERYNGYLDGIERVLKQASHLVVA